MSEEDKIVRVPGETLSIKVSSEEEAYRKKYLPDPKKLTDEKLVCTVCSISLAQNIHKGKDLYIHRALQVLVCEACYNFYGDGCFSADEDGDDKYCRWCGQGGTLYLCSKCNCGFCQKCTKQNLKASVLAELENDDWKCYICNPRPLFGCRTICWGAQQLNKIGKEKEAERLKKIKERLEKMEAKQKQPKERRSRKASSSEDEGTRKKRKKSSDEDSLSPPEVISAPKKRKLENREKRASRSMNGSTRRRKDSSSDSDVEEDKKVTRKSRSSIRKEKIVESSSEDESDHKRKKEKLKKKGKKKDDSDESDTGRRKPKRGSTKKKKNSDSSSSEDEKSIKKNKSVKKRDDSSDSSTGTKKKKQIKNKKNHSSSEDSSDERKKKHKKIIKKKESSSSEEGESSRSPKKTKAKPVKDVNKKQKPADSDNESPKVKKSTTDTEDVISQSAEDVLVKKRIKVAILWLSAMVKDISELGTLISLRAAKFSKKKINTENLKTYEDVLECVSKIKQLINGVHQNYDHIEKTLNSHLKPWKIMTGLEDAESEKNANAEGSMVIDEKDSTTNESAVKPLENKSQTNGTMKESKEESSIDKNDETLNNWSDDSDDQNETRALISKANESLEKAQIEDNLSDTNKNSPEDKKSESKKVESEDESSPKCDASEKPSNESKQKKDPTKESEESSEDPEKSNETKKDSEKEEESSPEKKSPTKKKSVEDEKSEKTPKKEEENKKTDSEGNKRTKHLQSDRRQKTRSGKDSPNKSKSSSPRHEDKRNSSSTTSRDRDKRKSSTSTSRDGDKRKSSTSASRHKEKRNSSSTTSRAGDKRKSSTSRLEDKRTSSPSRDKDKKESKMNLKQSLDKDSSNSSEEGYAKDADKKESDSKEKEEMVPKIVLKKLKSGGSKDDEDEVSKSSEEKCEDDSSRDREKKNETDSKGKEELVPKLVLKKLKREGSNDDEHEITNNSKDKSNRKKHEENSRSDEEGKSGKKTSTKSKSSKSTNKTKTKEEHSNLLSSSDEEEIKPDSKTKGKHSKKENKKEECDYEILDKSKTKNEKLKSKSSRKGKLQEGNSDDDDTTSSKKLKLNKLEGSNLENEETEKRKEPSSDFEEKNETQEEEKTEMNGNADMNDFTLDLAESSNENSNDAEMSQEKENVIEKKEEKTKKSSAALEEENVDSKNDKIKFVGLNSSSEEEEVKPKKTIPKRKAAKTQKKSRNVLALSSDDEGEQPAVITSSEDENDKIEKDEDFTVTLDDSGNSNDSEIAPRNKRKNKSSSDSDASISGEEKIKKKKRRRVKCADSSESGGSGDEKGNQDGESPTKGGRKNIKKIKKKGDLEQTTIEAAEEEKERRRRIEERQKLFNQVFEVKESTKLEKLVLDFDPETKKELISVNKDLVAKMKPHQAKGVKFMWDSCFESVKQIKKNKGSGCILAHCMGLGKTFQVVSLVHTLLAHEEYTKVRTVMVVCPLSTVLNWVNEFDKWLEGVEDGDIEVFHLTRYNKNPDRARELRRWQHNGGVLVMGYEMFRNLTNETTKKFKAKMKKDFLETLIDPGADLIVCDEGHMLKNEATALSKAMTRVKTLRRIVLTGTPMQNNLKEYHCMVQFVKPNLLGTSKEFLNRFVNPINNGQFVDSTDHDVKLMKRRAHVLHKMLEGLVQRFDYNVLTPFLPPKQEYVISVCLSELQEKLYSYYLENESQKAEGMKGGTRLFMDWQTLGRVWTHPRVLKMSTDKANWLKEKKAMEESDSEGSLREFIDDDSEKSTTTEESSDDFSEEEVSSKKKNKTTHRSRSTRSTRQSSNVALLESSDEEKQDGEDVVENANHGDWWGSFVEPQHFEDMRQSGKLLLLFAILKECEMIEDKVLVFSQSLFSLDLIEYFLDKIDCATQEGRLDENLDNHQGNWSKGLDYFRLDGSTSSENRNIWCKAFNREDNPRARLFLISTRAGGLGINLTAANRVIIFDASWNPSHDIQSIFRIYRFGQKKPCYVYRFVAYGTMEEKVYERQVAKQSISNRVVDEQQVHRHFSMNDLTELYTFTPASKLEDRPTPALPRDPLMTEILSQMKKWIEKYHEHDSLLENVVEEELNEEERKAAWEDYENDKKRGFMPPAGPQGPSVNPSAAWNQQIELMRQQLKLRYADKSDDEINQILVYQVSLLMRQQQQQQMQMMQAANNMGNMGYRPQMYGNNMMGGFNQRPQLQTTPYLRTIAPQMQNTGNLRNIAPKPSTQQFQDQVYRMQQQANMARLQQQLQQQKSQQSKGLLAQTLSQGAQLQRMKQNYQESRQPSRQPKPGVVITEITDDKPSGSSES
ncbi:transcriptional regulator ATRX homolog isoform X2 [Macrosteles quadrilineatus]|uniref:transcriptional regulator ATRX homolog isoform X2 n=1 Tax=Macrosteles quadrilineatus TaxID=74068 RepID=UPI0023E33BD3|nr:transcriptional regulator ATRX homolog isoform X2 [Macrosteles quadrilineatus]